MTNYFDGSRRGRGARHGASGAKLIKRRKTWKSRNAVSEIIGNMLILAITVIMFSGIFVFVASMDGPAEKVYTDFVGSVETNADGDVVAIKIINKGGHPLEDRRTAIYLFVSDTASSLGVSDGYKRDGVKWNTGDTWSTGSEWNYKGLTGVTNKAKISVMIVDVQTNTVVWEATLQGSDDKSTAPIIGSRGISSTNSPIAGNVYVGDHVRFFAYVSSPHGSIDPASVYVNASRLVGFGNDPVSLKSDGGGVYWSEISYPASQAWNGKVITFHASYVSGQSVSANFVVKVLTGGNSGPDNPLDGHEDDLVNGEYPGDASGGQSGGGNSRLGTTFYYIRNAATGEITRDFKPGDRVLIELYSNSMMNLALENSFVVTHPYTGEIMMEQSALTGAFSYGGMFSGFYCYKYTFDAPTGKLVYPFQIKMKDYYGTNLNLLDRITVSGATYPIIETYRLNETTNMLERTGDFTLTDKIYLKIITRDTDVDITKVKVGVIAISDYSGRYLIKTSPPPASASPSNPNYQSPLSSLFKTSSTSNSALRIADTEEGVYTVYIELKAADMSWWLPKKNSYTLTISSLTDLGNPGQGEIYHDITTQFNVTAPLSLTDIVASIGTGSFTWSSSGASWTNSKLVWFEKGVGSSAWGKTTIDDSSPAGPLAMALEDMDNDGIKDLVVAFQDGAVSIAWYKCLDVNGKTWSEEPHIITGPFDAHPGKQASGGTSTGINNEDTLVYYDGNSIFESKGFKSDYVSQNEICVAMEIGDFNGDGYIDIVASYAHVVVRTTATSENDAKNNPDKSQGMFFNRGVYVFWGGQGWMKTTLGSTLDWITGTPGANSNGNPAILDLAVGDFNKDGCDDIVGVDETGKTYIWMSAWRESVTSPEPYKSVFSSNPIIPDVTSLVGGYNPWEYKQRAPRVEVAQMDNQGYLDIIRTSTKNNNIYVIHTIGKDSSKIYTYPNKEYGTNELKPSGMVTHDLEGLDNGYIRDLIEDDNRFEKLTEVYLESDIFLSRAGSNIGSNGTGTLANVQVDDGHTYNLNPGQQLSLKQFSIGEGNYGKTVATAVLHVKYAVEGTYDGKGHILLSENGIAPTTTGIVPSASTHNVYQSCDLYANGVNTIEKINSLNIDFNHNGTVGIVKFDAIWLEITFVEGRYLEWQFEIPNVPGQSIHNLEVRAYCGTEDEKYDMFYSPDNTTWFKLGTIQGTVENTYSYPLYYTSNSKYYLKLVDVNRDPAQSANRSVFLDMIRIAHYSPGVDWRAQDLKMSPQVLPVSSNNYITAIAVGDVGSNSALDTAGTPHRADGLNDVVVATSRVGGGSGTNKLTLFVLTGQAAGGLDGPMAIDTSLLAASVGNTDLYDSAAIALGDFDADYDLDIVLVIGFAPGKSATPSIPTIWTYSNEPAIGSWTFDEAPLSALGANEAGINVEVGYVNLSLFFPFIGLAGIVVASISIERLAKRKR